MKILISLSTICLLLVACGTTKNTTQPQQPTDPVIVNEESETTPDTTEEESPAVPEKPEIPETPVPPQPPAVVSPELPQETQKDDPQTPQPSIHNDFDAVLNKHVSADGVVDYAGFARDRSKLKDYISTLGENLPDNSWSHNQKLAYWMNAYNAMTVDLILRNQPIESIKDINDPWEQRLWKLGSKWYNLDEIEHKILRKMGDARIHFGINCASFSCPPLANEAFTPSKVDQQLEALAIQFINDEKRNTLTKDRVEISKIFNWFSKDFKTEGSIIDYLNKYAETPINDDAKVRYKDYDWQLNN